MTATYRYGAYGSGINFNLATAATTFLFGGEAVSDPASGLYLHGDGTRGRNGFRFVQADTQGNGSNDDPISLHRYLYVAGDPSNMWDPSGHDGVGFPTNGGRGKRQLKGCPMERPDQ